MTSDVFGLTSANRRMIADFLETLDDDQWAAPTLCEGWTVHHLAAHLVQPMLVGFGRFFLTALRYRGDTARTVDHFTRRLAARPRAELIALLREHAADRVDPPRVGPFGPFAETCIHLRDIARPLGLAADVPAEHWRLLLDHLTSPGVAPALVPPGRLDGLRLEATAFLTDSGPNTGSGPNTNSDHNTSPGHGTGWGPGAGALISGPLEALGLAVTGRRAALADLHGPGLATLQARL
ncbi:maleylpyruvate isomerase family mycothiol-dependent enzyme [Actinoplanes friuliensis]|uniref:Mycothiol-dependent maleylpyruvate isomerase metal-binding domain-containing protein n=1 Tax=Actinoplanes friuliensis DSM 7358 TaxID=1246995 RepID=U5W161_9ACTN|nr:maleylpyruvate isomerase family mycothiol-dependent enzyme [Actinoplanes friuliensis]AGZ41631.1 hypothetical protein AFR_16765 [Actinoplanes friuliensis DSM 7358]